MKDSVDRTIERWEPRVRGIDLAALATFTRLRLVLSSVSAAKRAALRELGLGGWQVDTLYALRRLGRPYAASPTDVAAELGVTQAAMTARVAKLVDAGLARRRHDRDDGRRVIVQLTAAGLRVTDRILAVQAGVEADMIAALEPARRRAFHDNVRALYAAAAAEAPTSAGRAG